MCSEYSRQVKIKEILPLKGKFFFEVNELVLQLSNKRMSRDHPSFSNNFPSSPPARSKFNFMDVHEKLEVYRQAHPRPSFSSVENTKK